MKPPVVILPTAEALLLDTAKWWADHRSTDQAERWYEGIIAAMESLAENPRRCPIARENPKFPYEVRELLFGLSSRPTHRVLYTIRPESVVIVAVRHVAQQDVTPDDI